MPTNAVPSSDGFFLLVAVFLIFGLSLLSDDGAPPAKQQATA